MTPNHQQTDLNLPVAIQAVLKEYWGYDHFRPLQEDIIRAVLEGQDTLALMPTGGGKSLCYQLPALMKPGLCLVISPLIALMKDQVEQLRRKRITAFAIFSGMEKKEVTNILRLASESNCKFLYVSPERLETRLFKEYLPGLPINLLAVDEAHCISQWGYDFRPPYLRIAVLRDELPEIPVLALTASATPAVQDDILNKLSFRGHKIFRQSFERANLSYSVFQTEARINKVKEILEKVPGPSIIYCRSRKRTREIRDLLRLQQIPAELYHAGLSREERDQRQEDWISNKTRVIVCTNAFGMGIDKHDVRTVIHADPPDCLENYYQEAGRAGRDGKRSYAVLLYSESDLAGLHEMATKRFPGIGEIREVYQATANYLQVPSGGGAGQYYDFDFADFLKKFKLKSHTALYALKALEQDDWLAFNEQVFLPATIRFTIDKDLLYAFEHDHPGLEPVIKTLLRSYEGIYDQPTAISEKLLSGLLSLPPETVSTQLKTLHQSGVIDYCPRKDRPQLMFLRDRIRAEDLRIDEKAYRERKEQYQRRMEQMLIYISDRTACRSRIIGSYFGDENIPACGICDNCLQQKNSWLTRGEFTDMQQRIIDSLEREPADIQALMRTLGNISKEKAWKLLEFLQAENKITVDKTGKIHLK